MRRMEQNLGEKRVLFQSIEKKNSLRITYERLKLEEKAFISSTKFNRRQLLSRQNKLWQLQSTSLRSRRLSSEERPRLRTSFPELPGTSDGVIRGYASNSTLPCSTKSLRNPREGKQLKSLPGKDAFDGKESRLGTSGKLLHATCQDVANKKRNEFKVSLGQDRATFEVDSKTKQIRDSGLHVDDIIAYSVRFGKRAENSQRKVSTTGREHVDTTENHEQSSENKNFTVTNEKMWKSDVDSLATTQRMFDTVGFPEKEDAGSGESNQSSEKDTRAVKYSPMYITSVQRSPSVFLENIKTGTESGTNEVEPTIVLKTEDWLPKDVNLKKLGCLETNRVALNIDTTSDELKTSAESQNSTSLENFQPQQAGGQDVFISLNNNSSLPKQCDEIEQPRPSSSIPPLVSPKPSWHGYEDLPALGRIRRGSLCDVKTFTSSKVLHLLSSCEVPSPDSEKKESKQYLDINDENLKYCRYLRSATSGEEVTEDSASLKIPQKYRPSSNIIIGHTKVLPLQ